MQKKSGFTLVELMVVMAIIGVLTLIIGPPVNRWMDERGIHKAASQLAESLQRAKFRAIRLSANCTVAVNQGARQYIITENNPFRQEIVSLDDYRGGIVFLNADPLTGLAASNLITFTRQGLVPPPAAGVDHVIVVSNSMPGITPRTFRVRVSVAGGISIQRWDAAQGIWFTVT